MPRRIIRTGEVNEIVQADDQWEAWDTLRDRPILDFGLIATAEPDESGDPILVKTADLMRRWDRDDDAEEFDKIAKLAGLTE